MTRFSHQQRSGRTKAAKKRKHRRDPLGLPSTDALIDHRELEYLRHRSPERWAKLRQVLRLRGRDA